MSRYNYTFLYNMNPETMRKLICAIGLLGTMLCSCVQTEHLPEVEALPAMSFNLSDVADAGSRYALSADESFPVSRTLLDDAAINQSGNQLTVYDKYTSAAGQSELYMDGVVVTRNGSSWTYEPVKNWTIDGTHTFLAYLSKLGNIKLNEGNYPTVSYDETTSSLNVLSWKITDTNQFDFLYATHTRSMTETDPYRPVALAMNHLLCAVRFQVVNLTPVGDITIQSFKLTGLYHTGSAAIPEAGTPVIALTDNSGEAFSQTFTPGEVLGFNQSLTLLAGQGTIGSDGYILIWPHDTSHFTDKIKASLSYTYGGTEVTKAVSLADGSTKKWEAGKKYSYKLYVQDNRITFQVTVVPWVEDDVIIDG